MINTPHLLSGFGLTLATVCALSGCASSGQRSSAASPQTAPAQAGATASRRTNPFVLTSAEIAASPSLLNAYDAVQALRPHFLRRRGPVSLGTGASPTPDDIGVVVYLDRQRYGRTSTLRDIPVATIEEIRFLNVGEASSQFGMGHPHGVIQIITRRGPTP